VFWLIAARLVPFVLVTRRKLESYVECLFLNIFLPPPFVFTLYPEFDLALISLPFIFGFLLLGLFLISKR
jgi:hypothetical protein